MNWKKELFRNFRFYAITDLTSFDRKLPERVDRAFCGGIDIVQLRSKTLPDKEFLELGQAIRKIANRRKKLFIVNDRIDLALALEADGVHLGQDDLPIPVARKIIGRNKLLIGHSTHSVEQAKQAEKEGADYIGFGPIFRTPTKPTYQPIGLSDIARVKQTVKIPFVCIGGINLDNIDSVIKAGATRVAVVRAIFDQTDVAEAARRLRERILQ